jgi:hypothetical protein
LPSSRRVTSPSWTISSSNGYTDPGDGRHQPMLAFSTSLIMSAPFLGPVSSIESIHGRSQPLLLIPNILYRLFDIEYPIERFKPSAKEADAQARVMQSKTSPQRYRICT